MDCAVHGVAKSWTQPSDFHLRHRFLAAMVTSVPILGGRCPVFLHERNTVCLWNNGLLTSQPSAVLQRPHPCPGLPRPFQCGSVFLDRPRSHAVIHSVSHSCACSSIHGINGPRHGAGPPLHRQTDRQHNRGCGQVGSKQGPCLRRARQPHRPRCTFYFSVNLTRVKALQQPRGT